MRSDLRPFLLPLPGCSHFITPSALIGELPLVKCIQFTLSFRLIFCANISSLSPRPQRFVIGCNFVFYFLPRTNFPLLHVSLRNIDFWSCYIIFYPFMGDRVPHRNPCMVHRILTFTMYQLNVIT